MPSSLFLGLANVQDILSFCLIWQNKQVMIDKQKQEIFLLQRMKRDNPHAFSSLTEMYSAWTQFDLPVTFYHYLLSILKTKPKHEQQVLMAKQVSSLKSGTHPYLQIKSAIEARQNSLEIITKHLPLLKDSETLSKPLLNSPEQRQFLGYKKLFDTKQNPEERNESRRLRQLANHLVIYRKITLQVIFLIHKWMVQVMAQGYEGMVQFLYKNEDYLEVITQKTLVIVDQYRELFDFNPFFVLKKQVANGPHALVYDFLKITPDYAKNLYEALKLLAEHHTELLKLKMLGKHSLMSNKRKIEKSSSVGQLYGNLLNGKEYFMVKDSYLKSEKLLEKQNSTVETLRMKKNSSQVRLNSVGLQRPPLLINPQKYPTTNFIQRKYPTYFSDNTEGQLSKGRKDNDLTEYLLQRKYSSNIATIKHKNSLIIKDPLPSNLSKLINNGLEHEYKLKMVDQMNNSRGRIQDLRRTKTKEMGKMQSTVMEDSIEMTESQPYMDPQVARNESRVNIDYPITDSLEDFSLSNTKLQFKIQKNIQASNLLRYIRQTFKSQIQSQSPNQMTLQKAQTLTKALLPQRDHLTIYRIYQQLGHQENRSKQKDKKLIAWMVCKLYKDLSTLQKTVDIVFLYQFLRGLQLKQHIIEYFRQYGYCSMKENGKLVHQHADGKLSIEGQPIVRIKYKVSPFCEIDDLKQTIKSNLPLKMSRLLKYHSYSKTSKYHKYCAHDSKQSTCSISYTFESCQKVYISSKPHIKVKIDRVERVKQCYKIYHHLNSRTYLVMAQSMDDLKEFERGIENEADREMDRDESFDEKRTQSGFGWVCFEEGKVMRKYVNQKNKTLLNQFVWIQGNIPEVRSIALDKKDIVGSDTLVVSQPYILAIYGREDQEGLKSLAVLDFSQ